MKKECCFMPQMAANVTHMQQPSAFCTVSKLKARRMVAQEDRRACLAIFFSLDKDVMKFGKEYRPVY